MGRSRKRITEPSPALWFTRCATWCYKLITCIVYTSTFVLVVVGCSCVSGISEGKLLLQAKQQAAEDARAAERAQQQAQAAIKAQEEARAARQAEEEAQAILSAKEEARAARKAEEEAQAALKAEQQARAALQAELEAQSALRAEEAARAARRTGEEAVAAQQAKAQAEVNILAVTMSLVTMFASAPLLLGLPCAVIGSVMFGSCIALWLQVVWYNVSQ